MQRLLICIIYIFILNCKSSNKKINTFDLATVSIFNFVNQTDKNAYDYLSLSLGSATKKSMNQRFKYNLIDAKKTKEAFKENFIKNEYGLDSFLNASNELGSDALIFGEYSLSKKKQGTINISVKVYLRNKGQFIGKFTRSSKLDTQIFIEIEKIAVQTAELIYQYVVKTSINNDIRNTNDKKKILLTKKRLGIIPYVPPVF